MTAEPLLRASHVSLTYRRRRWFGSGLQAVPALEDVSLEVRAGVTLALAGASGSGKSTLARCLVLRESPSAGQIFFNGRPVAALGRRETREFRRAVQLISQDPGASLNPRYPAWWIVQEPLPVKTRARAAGLLSLVGLPAAALDRRPEQFSGGQRARLALARALACRPQLLILDESLAALDLSVQAHMVNLLLELQSRFGLAYLLITHDLSLAGHFADEIAVLDEGRIVAHGPPAELFPRPAHPALQRLLAAAPRALEAR